MNEQERFAEAFLQPEEEDLGYRLVLFNPEGEEIVAWDNVEEWDLTEDPTSLLATWLYRNQIASL